MMALAVAAGVAVAGLAPSAAQGAQAGTFTHMRFNPPPNGRVGYHLVSIIHIEADDTPTGDAVECAPMTDQSLVTVRGDPPPGVTFDASGPKFEGTPRQAGDWRVVVDIPEVWCRNGSNQTHYGPRSVTVNFTITP